MAPDAEALGGGYLATDRILVDGCGARFYYREEPLNDVGCEWRFMAGDECDEYRQQPANRGPYDVNIVVCNDRHIAPLLISPTVSTFDARRNRKISHRVHDFFPAG